MDNKIPDNWKDKLEDKKVFTNFPYLSIAQSDSADGKIKGGSIVIKDGEKVHIVSKLTFIPVAPISFYRQRSVWDGKKNATKIYCKGKGGQGTFFDPVYNEGKRKYVATANEPRECAKCDYNPKNEKEGGCKGAFSWVIFVEGLNKVVKWNSKPSQVGAFWDFKAEMDSWIDSIVSGKMWNPESTKLELSSIYSSDSKIKYYKPVFKKIDWVTDSELDLIKAVMSQEHSVKDEPIPDNEIEPDEIPFS